MCAALAAGNSYPVQPLTSYPNTPFAWQQSLGTLSGTVFNYANGGLSFVIGQAVKEGVLEHFDLTHDGMTGNAAHTVEVTLYKVPEDVSIQTAIYAGSTYRLATVSGQSYSKEITYSADPARVNISLDGEDMAGRRFARGDRLVATFRSTDDSPTTGYYTTALANVFAAAMGRYGNI